MKILIQFLWILSFIQFTTLPQCKIQVIVITSLPEVQKVFITGNKPEIGNWNPNKISLNKINDSTWSKMFDFMIGESIEFKFTKGSWDEEALNESGTVSGNIVHRVLNDTTLVFRIKHWGNSKLNVTGQITGKVRYYKNFEGRSVLPRDIIVWLPPSYDSLTDKYYPVLYMQDGQNIFDPSTSSFGIDWQIDETADSLIKSNSIREIIVVGIYNTSNRGNEYRNTEIGSAYIDFVLEELKTFIDKTYRTIPDKENTAVGGSSGGGLISFIMLWEHSDVFSKAACLSPAFKIEKIDYIAPIRNYLGSKKNIKIYIDNGGIGMEQKLQPGIDEMLAVLKEKGFVEDSDLLYFKDPTAEHNEYAWAKRVYRFLEFMFPLKK